MEGQSLTDFNILVLVREGGGGAIGGGGGFHFFCWRYHKRFEKTNIEEL